MVDSADVNLEVWEQGGAKERRSGAGESGEASQGARSAFYVIVVDDLDRYSTGRPAALHLREQAGPAATALTHGWPVESAAAAK